MRGLLTACLLMLGMIPGLARAQDNPVVVELYTSQGCSSCPPADEMLLDLAARQDVIALALHVDYWDYIGWVDAFADPGYTRRQQNYARVAGHTTIYTPQMVIGGQDHVVGTKPMDVADAIRRQRGMDHGVSVRLVRSGGTVTVRLDGQGTGRALVQLVRYTPRAVVDIHRGENAGRQITYGNIVTDWRVIGEWDGQGAATLSAPARGDQPIVVIVQEPGPGAILAAARIE